MQTYDLNNRSVEPLSATPSGPTIFAATTDVQPICTICRKPFPRVLSKVSGLPFQRCQPCNYKARNPTVATAPTAPTPAQVITAQGQLKKAQAVLLAAKVDYKVTSETEPLIPPPTSRDADSLNRYMQSQNYSLTATATTATSPNCSPPSNDLTDMPWLSDSGATYSSTNNLSDLHRPVLLLTPIPITGADGTIIHATHVGSAHFDTSHAVYFVPRSAVKLVSLGALTASGYSVRTDRDRSFVITRPTGTTLCSCPIQPNNTWIFPSHLMTGKILPTTAVPTRISVAPGATVLPFSIPRDGRHFTKEEVKRATLARELHHFLGHPHDRALKLTLDQGHLTHHTHLTSHDIDLMTDFYGSCLACTAGKIHNTDLHVTSSSPPSTNVGDCVFFDLQLLTTASVGGNTQALIAIDDRSGYISVLGSKSKDKHDIMTSLEELIATYKCQKPPCHSILLRL